MEDIQTDIFSFNETKLDTRNSKVQHDIRQKSKPIDQHIRTNMNSSLQTPRTRESFLKPGGTMMVTRGHWAGRMLKLKNDKTMDPMGRWTVIHLKGKGNTIISIFSIDQVCLDDEGENTSSIQQQNDLYDKRRRLFNPRTQIVKDLQPILADLIRNNHKVIINADINDDAGMEFKNQWNAMMEETGMRNIIQSKHNQNKLP